MTEVEELEQQILNCKEKVALGNAVSTLMKNEDFKKVILESYCREERDRQLGLSVSPRLNKEKRDLSYALAQATGALNNFLLEIMTDAARAEDEIKENEDALIALRNAPIETEDE